MVGLALVFVGTTWAALEWSGVGRMMTTTPSGDARETHVWYVEPDGELWVEVGHPDNPWFLDVRQNPRIRFRTENGTQDYMAEPFTDRESHARVRALQSRRCLGQHNGF